MGFLHRHHGDREALQLSPRQHFDVSLKHVVKLQVAQHLVADAAGVLGCDQRTDVAADRLGDVVDVLRFGDGADVVSQNLRKVVLQLGAAVVPQNLLPSRRRVEASQVRLQLAREHLQRRGLADAVRADEPEHLTRPRHWQPVQLEAVGAIAVDRLPCERLGQVDDHDRLERALLDANATADAKFLADPRAAASGLNLDTEAACDNGRGVAVRIEGARG